jgi:polysaccharide biosynthesis transport protein
MDTSHAPGRGLHPLLSLRRHFRISLIVAVAVVLIGMPFAWIMGRSHYVAEAVFQVSPNFQKNVSADKEHELQSNSQYREFVNHLSRTALRYDVLQRALARIRAEGAKPCLSSETDRKCVERLQRQVFVIAIADTYMVRIGLKSGQAAGLDKIVNGIMDAFLDTTRAEQIYGSDERAKVLDERTKALTTEISGFAAQRSLLAARLGLTTFGENTANPYDAVLAQAREKLTLATIERSQAQATLAAFGAHRETPASAGRSVLEMRLQDTGLQALRNEVVKRSEELGRTMVGLEERHPARAPAASEQEEINQRLQTRESAFEKSAQQNVRARFTASLAQTQQVEKEARERVQAIAAQATTFATDFREAVRLTGEIRKREQELDELRNRLNYLGTERNAIGFVRLITPALPAETPQGLGKLRLLLVLLAGAGLLVFAVPALIDMLDRRVLVAGDAERAMGIAAAGWIVEVDGAASRILAADQTRRLASTLLRQRARGAHQAFGFTSARVGGGTTALVRELAHTLGQLGSRVLIVDANSLSPGASPVIDGPGLSELLSGRAGADDVIHECPHEGRTLALVPFGAAGEAGIERLDRLRDGLAHWSARWDIILVDIAPILPSADAELLVDVVGQVFLVAEAGMVSKRDVIRARAVLEQLDPGAVGLIVNKVSMESGGSELTARMVETITGGRFRSFMSLPWLRLQWQILLARRGAGRAKQ